MRYVISALLILGTILMLFLIVACLIVAASHPPQSLIFLVPAVLLTAVAIKMMEEA